MIEATTKGEWEMRLEDKYLEMVPGSLHNKLMVFKEFIDLNALLKGREEAMTEMKKVTVKVPLPRLLGSVQQYSVYTFDGQKTLSKESE